MVAQESEAAEKVQAIVRGRQTRVSRDRDVDDAATPGARRGGQEEAEAALHYVKILGSSGQYDVRIFSRPSSPDNKTSADEEAEAASVIQDAMRGALADVVEVNWRLVLARAADGVWAHIKPDGGASLEAWEAELLREGAAATAMQAAQRGKAARAEADALKETEAANVIQDAMRAALGEEAEKPEANQAWQAYIKPDADGWKVTITPSVLRSAEPIEPKPTDLPTTGSSGASPLAAEVFELRVDVASGANCCKIVRAGPNADVDVLQIAGRAKRVRP